MRASISFGGGSSSGSQSLSYNYDRGISVSYSFGTSDRSSSYDFSESDKYTLSEAEGSAEGSASSVNSWYTTVSSWIFGETTPSEKTVEFNAQTASLSTSKVKLCFREPERDRDVDNDVQQRSQEAVGNFDRDSQRERLCEPFRTRPWSETGKDAALAAEKLWEAAQMAKTGTGGKVAAGAKCLEAAKPAARVVEDVARGTADAGVTVMEKLAESRYKTSQNGMNFSGDM